MDHRELFKIARRQGWAVEQTRKNHVKLTSPTGQIYFTGSTPSDYRAGRNLASDLRKLGLDIPDKTGRKGKGRR